jgi:nitroreductase
LFPFPRWYEAIWQRRSRRLFYTRPVYPRILEHLNTFCNEFRPFKEARAVLVNKSPEKVFKGILANYGKIRGAPAFIAFVGNIIDPHIHEKIGYTGEGVILEATALNLGTCWVGVSFRPETAASLTFIGRNEKVFAVTPVGYAMEKWSFEEKVMTGFGRTHKRKALRDLVTGMNNNELPAWIKKALEAASEAPSAVNRQPWRFYVEPDSITISVDNLSDTYKIPKRLDCGIAMLHIEIVSLNHDIQGEWEFLEPPDVARFKVKGLIDKERDCKEI